MNEIDLQKLVEDMKEITAEMLEEIRQSELKADPDGEAKILKALGEVGSMVYRDLRARHGYGPRDSRVAWRAW